MEGDRRSGNERPGKFTVYVWTAVVSLLLLALTSSIDSFFVYIFLGISVFFFILAFGARPRADQFRHGGYTRGAQPGESDYTSFFKNRGRARPGQTEVSKGISKGLVIMAVGILLVVLLPVVVIIGLAGSEGDVMEYNSRWYIDAGDQFFGANEFDSALVNYRRGFKLDAGNTDALCGYGKALSALEQYDSALIVFNRILTMDPTQEDARYSRGQVYFVQEKYQQAIQDAEAVLRQNGSFYSAMLLAGDCYYRQQQYDPALAWYVKAYDNDIRSRDLCWLMAYIYDEKNQTDKAIALYRETLSYDSTVVEVYDRLGALLPGQPGDVFRRKAAALRLNN